MLQVQKTAFTLMPPHGRPFSADATFLADNQPKPVVIFVHGFKGFKDWGYWNLLAQYFAEHHFAFVKLNLSHNGTTPQNDADLHDMEAFGNNNFSKELTDLETLLNYLHAPDCPFKPELNLEAIHLIGHSRGGGLVLLYAASEPRIKALATWASVSNLNPGYGPEVLEKWKTEGVLYNLNTRTNLQMPLYYQLYEDYAANPERFDVARATAALKQPLLIVHGDSDAVVPLSKAHELKASKPEAAIFILAGADHSFGGSHPYLKAAMPDHALQAAQKTAAFFRGNS